VPHVAVLASLLAGTAWMREVAAGDGAHPGAAGYAELAALVRPAWDGWIAAPGR
jgi:acyl-CoA thioesterase-1